MKEQNKQDVRMQIRDSLENCISDFSTEELNEITNYVLTLSTQRIQEPS